MRSLRVSLILSLLTAFGSNTLADGNAHRPVEFQVLDHFAGTWFMQFTQTPSSGESTSIKHRSIRTPSLGGKFMRFEEVVENGPETHMLLTYDPKAKNYPAVFMSGASRSNLTGTWNEAEKTMRFTGTMSDGNQVSSAHRFVADGRAEVSGEITSSDGEVLVKLSWDQTRLETPELFEQRDINGDGFIDLEEVQALLKGSRFNAKQSLDLADTNRDGKISRIEAAAFEAFKMNSQRPGTKEREAAEKIVQSMDSNRDDRISKVEASDLIKPYFEMVDTNGDGFIDAIEAWSMAYSAQGR